MNSGDTAEPEGLEETDDAGEDDELLDEDGMADFFGTKSCAERLAWFELFEGLGRPRLVRLFQDDSPQCTVSRLVLCTR